MDETRVENLYLGHATAYGYAKAKGYEGTEEEFAQLCADLGIDIEQLENMTVIINMLDPDADPSGTYSDGVLTLNLPRGVKGDTGESAYEYAVAGGYTGTEEEFTQLCADLGIEVDYLENMTVVVNMVDLSVQPSASYIDGTLTLNIQSATDAQVEAAADAWLQENITNPSNPPLDRSLTLANAAAPADLVGDLKSALVDEVEAATVTQTLNGTVIAGLTLSKVDGEPNEMVVYGTPTASRHLLFLNGQKEVKASSSAFSKTLNAGTYEIRFECTGHRTTAGFYYTTTTFSSKTQLQNGIITFANDVMIGLYIDTPQNWGTSEDTTVISFSAKKLLAKDPVARESAAEANTLLNNVLYLNRAKATTIEDETDYDTLTTPGSFLCTTSEHAATMTHAPSEYAHRLIVMQSTGSDKIFQIALVYASGASAIVKIRDNTSGTWKDWRVIADRYYVDGLITNVTSAISAEKTVVNGLHSLIDYDYDTPFEQEEDPSASGYDKKVGIKRDEMVVVLNKSSDSTTDIRIKITGNVEIAGNSSGISAWTSGLTLKTGHTYRVVSKLLSGGCYKETQGDGKVPSIVVYEAGTSTSVGASTSDEGIATRAFVPEENKQYVIAILVGKNYWRMTNAKFLITLEDVSESGEKLPRTGTYEYFTVAVERPLDFGGDGENVTTTTENVECLLALPDTYRPTGTPTRLILWSHGNGGFVSKQGVYSPGDGVVHWKAIGGGTPATPTWMTQQGYAVFDSNIFSSESLGESSTVDDWEVVGRHKGSALYVNVLKKAYDYIKKHYNVEDKIFVYGFSMGGATPFAFSNAYPQIVLAGIVNDGSDYTGTFSGLADAITNGTESAYFSGENAIMPLTWGYDTYQDLLDDKFSHVLGTFQFLNLKRYDSVGNLIEPPNRETDFVDWLKYYGGMMNTDVANQFITAFCGTPIKMWRSTVSYPNSAERMSNEKRIFDNGGSAPFGLVIINDLSHTDMAKAEAHNMRNQFLSWIKRWE